MPIIDQTDPRAMARYEDFIAHSPHGVLYQSIHWANVKENWTPDYITVEEDGKIIAALSIISVHNPEGSFSYAVRGPVCDVYDIDLVKRLVEEAKPVLEKRKSFLLRMDPEARYDEDLIRLYEGAGFHVRSRSCPIHSFSNPRLNMVVYLDQDPEDLMMTFEGRFRSKIRRAFKKGVEIDIYQKDDPEFEEVFDRFYEMTGIMAERQEIGYRPKDYYHRLFEAYENTYLYEASHEGDHLASCIVINYNDKSLYLYAASTNEKRNLNASTAMNWKAIEDATRAGYKEYDMTGVWSLDEDDGLYRFKKKFTGERGIREFVGEFDWILDQTAYDTFMDKQRKK